MSRLRAFSRHLLLSLLVLAAVMALVRFAWFPGPYAEIADIWPICGLIAAIHLLPFPLLTALVYKPGKKSLRFDLGVLALLQLAALGFGAWTLHSERPLYLVHAVDRFTVLAAKDLGSTTSTDFPNTPWRGPLAVVALLPEDPEQLRRLTEETVFGRGPDIDRRPEFWSSYASSWRRILLEAEPLTTLLERRADQAELIIEAAESAPGEFSDFVVVPLIGKRADFSVIISRGDGVIRKVLPVDPWIY